MGVLLLFVALPGCWSYGWRSQHVVDGQVVSSPPPPPSVYEVYLRARLAFECEPPALDEARFYIEHALQLDPQDPHLWATRAEIEEHAGDKAQAAASARRALAIRPGYPLAEEVLARVEGGGSGQTASAPAVTRQP